ncbi:MAG: thioredoxin family protein [Actinomycetota bacterium]
MERVLIAVAIVAVVGIVALIAQRRRAPDAPTQRRYRVPDQLDRADFPRADAPWLVAIFSSSTCTACADVLDKARVLESGDVAVTNVDHDTDRATHERYTIDAVPTTVIADDQGVVHDSFIGPMSATDLWAAVARVRDPTQPAPQCGEHDGDPH